MVSAALRIVPEADLASITLRAADGGPAPRSARTRPPGTAPRGRPRHALANDLPRPEAFPEFRRRARPGDFDDAAVDNALVLAYDASLALILMNRRGISAGPASDILRRTSQDLNVKLVDLAATVAQRNQELDIWARPGRVRDFLTNG